MAINIENFKTKLDEMEKNGELDNFRLKIKKENEQEERNYKRIKRIIKKIGLDNFIEKCQTWYGSDKYVKREYKLGYEPRVPLFWYLYEYFKEFGEETNEGVNMFMETNYQINDCLVGVMHGQGSVVKIGKLEPPKISDFFLNFNLSKELLNLGFNDPCFGYFLSKKDKKIELGKPKESKVVAIMWQQAFDWFKRRYKLYTTYGAITTLPMFESYFYSVMHHNQIIKEIRNFETEFEAKEEVIKYLIEYIKQNIYEVHG